MNRNRNMAVLRDCLKKNNMAIILLSVVLLMNFSIFILYDVIIEPFAYSAIVALFFGLLLFAVDYVRELKKAKIRERALLAVTSECSGILSTDTLAELDYRTMISTLEGKIESLTAQYSDNRQEMLDYYTTWVHQIKTPISVMKLKLAADNPQNRELAAELFRIEEYVDMVLQYIRLESGSNDLFIQEYSLDELIREPIRKFAPQFILHKLKLVYEPTKLKIVTDKKWFSYILEQLLSNAIKYTPKGTISICVQDGHLMISDTGIGIAAEDLPRIFEKGYTGVNGRIGQKSSGLGLFLAKKAADLLSISISVKSKVGEGSSFCLDISQKH